MTSIAKQQKKIHICFMIANSASEVLHIYTDTLYTKFEHDNTFLILSGKFAKRILVAVSSEDHGAVEKELLLKMLTACELKEEDYHIAAFSSTAGLHAFISFHNPDVILLFGLSLDTTMVQLNKPMYKPFRFNNIKMILCDTLTKISQDSALKSTLWTAGLKPLFNI